MWTPLIATSISCRALQPLHDTPIIGGTEAERQILQEELERFEDVIGPGRISLRAIRVIPLRPGDPLGRYHSGNKTITVAQSDEIAVTLRHELCHALDDAEELVSTSLPLFDELSAGIFATHPYSNKLSTYRTADLQRGEALALFCEPEPLVWSAIIEQECLDTAPIARVLARWLLENVYIEYEPAPAVIVDRSTAVTLDAWAEGDWTVHAASVPHAIAAIGEDPAAPPMIIDLYSGRLLHQNGEMLPDVEEVSLPPGFAAFTSRGWREGPAAATGIVPLEHLPAVRLFVGLDPVSESWHRIDDDCRRDVSLFTADGEVWASWNEGYLLRWAPLTSAGEL